MIEPTMFGSISEHSKKSVAHHTHLLVLTMILMLFGLMMVYSSSALYAERTLGNSLHFTVRHVVHAVIGVFFFFVASQFNYRYLQKLVFLMMIVSFIMLLLVLIPGIGVKVGGARRWLNFLAFTFQPADFLKFAVMVWIADFLQRKSEHIRHFGRSLLPPLLIMLIFALLLVLQPDFGSVILILVSLLMVTLIAGVRMSHLVFVLFSAGVASVFLIVNSAYRSRRISAFIDPWGDTGDASYQLSNALIAYGGGGFFGRGPGNSLQKEYYLPQAHTDFISAVMAEEIGLFGFGLFLTVYTTLIMKGFAITTQCKDEFGRNLGFGITIIIAFQALFHICVTMGLLPTKGIGIPLISYGGSSIVMTLTMLGVLYNIGHRSSVKEPVENNFFKRWFAGGSKNRRVSAGKRTKIISNKRKYFNKRSG